MTLKVLGSAAAEGWPAPFCICDACQEARRRGGKDIRRRTAYQLGDCVHVDWGPDSYSSMIAFGLDYSPLRHLFITHSHQDHWCPQELHWRRPGFACRPEDSWLTIYGNRQVGELLFAQHEDLDPYAMSFRQAEPFETLEIEPDLKVIPLPASHAAEDETALNYLFQSRGKLALIGNDTGWWGDETWDFLLARLLHVVLLDCTSGPLGPRPDGEKHSWIGSHHLNCHWVVAVKDRLSLHGALAPGHRFIANHFSHNGGWLQSDLEAFFQPQNIEVGYDGMEVSF